MHYKQITPYMAVFAAALLLAACNSYVQTTSGAEYLNRYKQARYVNTVGTASTVAADDQAVHEIANVEPELQFPARVGIARVFNGRLSTVPAHDAQQWRQLADRLGPGWGEFVPISPLVAALAAGSVPEANTGRSGWHGGIEQTIRAIRFGAARQHVDAVLIYEVFSDSDVETNVLSVTKLILVGYLVAPSEEITANGFANAMLVDVRNGYVYGYAQSGTEDPVETLSTSASEHANVRRAEAAAQTGAVDRLVVDVEKMARELRLQLAEQRSKAKSSNE